MKIASEQKWKSHHIDIYQKQIFNEHRRSSWAIEEKQSIEIQIFWTQFLRLLQILFSWILHIRNASVLDWNLWSTWRMKECVHRVIQMKCKNNDCTDVCFTMYRIQETQKYYAIRTDNRQCRRKSDIHCEQLHLRHRLMRKIRAWLLKLILPRICNQMMTKENQKNRQVHHRKWLLRQSNEFVNITEMKELYSTRLKVQTRFVDFRWCWYNHKHRFKEENRQELWILAERSSLMNNERNTDDISLKHYLWRLTCSEIQRTHRKRQESKDNQNSDIWQRQSHCSKQICWNRQRSRSAEWVNSWFK